MLKNSIDKFLKVCRENPRVLKVYDPKSLSCIVPLLGKGREFDFYLWRGTCPRRPLQFLLHKQHCFEGPKLCHKQDQFQERLLLLIFPPAYIEALAAEKHNKYYRRQKASLHKRHLDSCVNRGQNEGGYFR